jgi:hypothetical protein
MALTPQGQQALDASHYGTLMRMYAHTFNRIFRLNLVGFMSAAHGFDVERFAGTLSWGRKLKEGQAVIEAVKQHYGAEGVNCINALTAAPPSAGGKTPRPGANKKAPESPPRVRYEPTALAHQPPKSYDEAVLDEFADEPAAPAHASFEDFAAAPVTKDNVDEVDFHKHLDGGPTSDGEPEDDIMGLFT